MKRATLLALILAGLVAGCSDSTALRTVTVKVPVGVNCVPSDLPAAPDYPDEDRALLSAPDAAERYRLLILGRELRIGRLGLLEGVAHACQEGAPSER